MTILPETNLSENFKVPKVITGLWQVADLERDGNRLDLAQKALDLKKYAESGFTTFDMADHYGSAEDITGIYKNNYSKELPIQAMTKWVPEPGLMTRQKVREAVNTSLKRLQSEQIDLLQFHAWNYADPAWLDSLFFLQELKQEGLIKHLGLTNFDTAHLRIVVKSGIEVISNQICFSLLDRRAAQGMTSFCTESGIRLFAFGTLAGGFLSEKWLGKPEPELNESMNWSQMKYKRFIDQAGGWTKFQSLLQTLDNVAKKYNASIANIATRFIIDEDAVAAVIIGARLGENSHIENNSRLFSFNLSKEDKRIIQQVVSELDDIPGDCGDEYRKPPFLTASGDLSHHLDDFTPPYPTKQGGDGRTKALSGTVWEDVGGFSRAIRKGNVITISGTTATHGNLALGGDDPIAQTHAVIDKIEGALQSLGSSLQDVIRTRIFVKNLDDWEPVARAHGERFKDIQPANTLVQALLVGDEYLVEIEADALIEE